MVVRSRLPASMMKRAWVKKGRCFLDEPMDVPVGAGAELGAFGDDLDDEDGAWLHGAFDVAEDELRAAKGTGTESTVGEALPRARGGPLGWETPGSCSDQLEASGSRWYRCSKLALRHGRPSPGDVHHKSSSTRRRGGGRAVPTTR